MKHTCIIMRLLYDFETPFLDADMPGLDPHSSRCGHFSGQTHLSSLLPAPLGTKLMTVGTAYRGVSRHPLGRSRSWMLEF
jgi:hypothetical protein